jgi:hypothetical protein
MYHAVDCNDLQLNHLRTNKKRKIAAALRRLPVNVEYTVVVSLASSGPIEEGAWNHESIDVEHDH